jgi:hypothetical protein
MEYLIKDLMERMSNRKKCEMAYFDKYKNEGIKDLMMVSARKIMELDYLVHELKVMNKYKSKIKNY